MEVTESDFTAGQLEGGIELPNGLAKCNGISDMDLPIAVRVGGRSAGLHGQVSLTGNRVVISREPLEVGNVSAAHVGAQVEDAVTGEMAVVEAGRGVEIDGRGVMTQDGVTQSDGSKGNLDRRGKRIPVTLKWFGLGCGGGGEIEIHVAA